MQTRRQGIEPFDLRLDECQIRRSVSGLAADDGGDVRRHVAAEMARYPDAAISRTAIENTTLMPTSA